MQIMRSIDSGSVKGFPRDVVAAAAQVHILGMFPCFIFLSCWSYAFVSTDEQYAEADYTLA